VTTATSAAVEIPRLYPEWFAAKAEPRIVELPAVHALAIEGQGSPESAQFQEAVGALYSVAWTLKMALKKEGRDFKVSALEGLWWTPGEGDIFDTDARESWHWKLLIVVPPFVAEEDVAAAREAAARKKANASIAGLRLEELSEGRACQVLHVGPYATESATIQKMREAIATAGHTPRGRHHEIYLSDPNRVAPEKMRTILRQPVA
jgi:hypothetical protein